MSSLHIKNVFDLKVKILVSRIILFALLSSLAGCASIKPYPVCFYNCDTPDEEKKIEIIKKLSEVLEKETNKEVVIHPNLRWILVKTNNSQHRRLTKIWPRIACVGNVTSGTQVSENSDCVKYLYEFMKKKKYLKFDIQANPIDSDEAPGAPYTICCCQFE